MERTTSNTSRPDIDITCVVVASDDDTAVIAVADFAIDAVARFITVITIIVVSAKLLLVLF